MRRHPAVDAALLLMLCLPALAQARSTDRDAEMQIDATGLDTFLTDDGETRLTGVTIAQGTLKIEAADATVTRAKGEITRILLEGTPAKLQQQNDNGELMRAHARRIDHDPVGEMIVLTGAVEVDQGSDTLRGEKLTYDTKSGRLTAAGGAGDGKVRMTIKPKPSTPSDTPAEPAAAPAGAD
jgi:lipopolysaccharide export system protein LptA